MTGTAFIKFIEEKDGSLNDIRVLKGVSNCEACDEEAINLVKSMPKWKQATLGDKIVKSYFNLPIIYIP